MTSETETALSLTYIHARSATAKHWTAARKSWEGFVDKVTNLDGWATTKDCGGYVLGDFAKTTSATCITGEPCTALHRRAVAVVNRCALTLDADKVDDELIDAVHGLGVLAVAHTTWSHEPDAPRWRIIIPLERRIDADEFQLVTQFLMSHLGAEQFDPKSLQPEQLMFWPASPDPDTREAEVFDGPLLDPDKILRKIKRDAPTLPLPKISRNKRDPHELPGTPGAVNRAYRDDLDTFIDRFELPYDKESEYRYRLRDTHSMAGFGPIDGSDGLYFSHHANDPAHGLAVSLFDLYRLHKYGHLDETKGANCPVTRLPSYDRACKDLSTDPLVLRELIAQDFAGADAPAEGGSDNLDLLLDENAWQMSLHRNPRTGEISDKLRNWELIAEHEPWFSNLYWDGLSSAPLWTADPPWRKISNGGPEVSMTDRQSACLYLERAYEVRPPRTVIDSMIDDRAMAKWSHPVKDWLLSLEWDGVERVETCLPGVDESPYTRLVARKALVAAVARVMEPGVKTDHMMILHGGEGLGKTWWIERMSMGWSSTLGPLGAKDTLLTAHRSWIVNADESHSMRKADADTLKEFLTRRVDVFRAPYERAAVAHPRQFVFWATTNDETFLRQQEGNRRYLPIRVERRCNFDLFSDEYVAQIWAEALHLWGAGESLAMSPAEEKICADARLHVTEEDPITGVIGAWLDAPRAPDWESLPMERRMMYQHEMNEGIVDDGEPLRRVCTMQVWVEAMGRRPGEHKRVDLLLITESLRRLGWVPGKKDKLPLYGTQQVWYPPNTETDSTGTPVPPPAPQGSTPRRHPTDVMMDLADLI